MEGTDSPKALGKKELPSEAMVQDDTEWLKSSLGKRVRITLVDGQVFDGIFKCIDRDQNAIVLDKSHGRTMIPGDYILKFERKVDNLTSH